MAYRMGDDIINIQHRESRRNVDSLWPGFVLRRRSESNGEMNEEIKSDWDRVRIPAYGGEKNRKYFSITGGERENITEIWEVKIQRNKRAIKDQSVQRIEQIDFCVSIVLVGWSSLSLNLLLYHVCLHSMTNDSLNVARKIKIS